MLRRLKNLISLLLILSLFSTMGSVAAVSKHLESDVVGDVDLDGRLAVIDGTKIQRTLAMLDRDFFPIQRYLADVDADRTVTIIDVTNIQRKLASLSNSFFADTIVSLYDAQVVFSSTYLSGTAIPGDSIDFRFTSKSNITPQEYRYVIDGVLVQDFNENNTITKVFTTGGSHQFDISIRNTLGESVSFSWRYDVLGEPASGDPVIPDEQISSFEHELIRLVNELRAKNGLSALKTDKQLCTIARMRARDMVDHGYVDHYSPTYGYIDKMLNDYHVKWTMAGENLAYEAPSAQYAMDAWMKSETHQQNLLDPKYEKIGIGYVPGSGIWVCEMIRESPK